MPKFKYKASNMSGQTIDGVYEAANQEAVRYMLRQKSFYPLEIGEVVESVGSKQIDFSPKISAKNMTIFCQQFAAILEAGVPLSQGLEIMSQQSEDKRLKEVLLDVHQKVQTGRSLTDSFKDHPSRFSDLFFSMLQSGELAGTLSTSFTRLGVNYEKDNAVSRKLKNAMIYPSVLAVVAIAVIWLMMTQIIPRFTGIFESAGASLPKITQMMINFSDFVGKNGVFILGVLLIIILIRITLKSKKGRFEWDKLKLRLPVFGKLITKVVAARFTRTLSTLFGAGVSLTSALESTAHALGNAYVEQGVMEVAENVRQGRSLASTIDGLKIFPPMVVHMTRIGEESGSLETMLNSTAEFYDQEASDAITRMMALMEPAIILVLGGIVLFIVLSIFLPMLNMMNLVQM